MKANGRRVASALAAGLLLAGFSVAANANFVEAVWTDVYDPYPDLLVPPSQKYTHDITDEASGSFRPGTDALTWFQLTVDLYSVDEASERAFINVPTFWWEIEPFGDDKGFGDNWYWNVSGTEFGGWSLAGLLTLNLGGTYSVTVESLYGDFLFGSSRLDARGYRQVPEPGILALLAIGLIGMGVALARRRKHKK